MVFLPEHGYLFYLLCIVMSFFQPFSNKSNTRMKNEIATEFHQLGCGKKKKTAVVNQQVERRVTIADGENTATAVREFSSCRRVDRNRRFSRTSLISGAGTPQTRSH